LRDCHGRHEVNALFERFIRRCGLELGGSQRPPSRGKRSGYPRDRARTETRRTTSSCRPCVHCELCATAKVARTLAGPAAAPWLALLVGPRGSVDACRRGRVPIWSINCPVANRWLLTLQTTFRMSLAGWKRPPRCDADRQGGAGLREPLVRRSNPYSRDLHATQRNLDSLDECTSIAPHVIVRSLLDCRMR